MITIHGCCRWLTCIVNLPAKTFRSKRVAFFSTGHEPCAASRWCGTQGGWARRGTQRKAGNLERAFDGTFSGRPHDDELGLLDPPVVDRKRRTLGAAAWREPDQEDRAL